MNTSTLGPFNPTPAGARRAASPAAGINRPRVLTGDVFEELVQALSGLNGAAGRAGRQSLKCILLALRAHDADTYSHSVRTLRLCALLGYECGIASAHLRVLKLGALLHDIGKVRVPREVLHRPGALTDEDWAAMRCHPRDGQRLLLGIPALADVARVVLQHHERWDGAGYPQGLSGEAIELNARVIAVADAFDSMVNDRSYRPALTLGAAFAELSRCAGTQFDPHIVAAFHRVARAQIATNMRQGRGRILLCEHRHSIQRNAGAGPSL